jgi:hypothetical protein
MTSLVSIFNNHLIECFDDILIVFPSNTDILAAKNSIIAIKQMNPAIVIKTWKKYIADRYLEQINNDDVSFFISKDYSNDLVYSHNPDKIIETINRLRDPIRNMNESDQIKTMKYIKNLTKMSLLYVQ